MKSKENKAVHLYYATKFKYASQPKVKHKSLVGQRESLIKASGLKVKI